MNLERSSRGLLDILFLHLSGGNEEITGNSSQDSRCPGRDSNQELLEYESIRSPPRSLFGFRNVGNRLPARLLSD
jgi:hypothetical protein